MNAPVTTASPGSAATTTVHEGDVLRTPSSTDIDAARLTAFRRWLRDNRGLTFADYDALWRWSVDDLDGFWSALADFAGIRFHDAPRCAFVESDGPEMPGAQWFPDATLNFAEHMLGTDADTDRTAVIGISQTRPDVELTFGELREQVRRARNALSRLGIGEGDRVVGYLPNIPETLAAHLAVVSLGAIWATCATEFGARSVIDRFGQVEPDVLLVAGGYRYGDKDIDRADNVAEIRANLPTLRAVVDIDYGPWRVPDAWSWTQLLAEDDDTPLSFTPVAFDHPLAVLFSSGTTGVPKAIVHGHGGILLEHWKNDALSWNLGPDDRMLWFSTTAWMMWNALVSALLVRASIVMIDGNPAYPGPDWQWQLAAKTGATFMGAAPGFVMAGRAAGVDLSGLDLKITTIGSAGAPLPPEGYAWLRDQLGDVDINVGSGGTDVCTGIVQHNPLLPVTAGRISGRSLGVAATAFDEDGNEIVGEPGELVITRPMPSMPVCFWNDPEGTRLADTYFDRYAGIWRHGDWITFYPDGSCVVSGRSDATLNRGGVRLGTAEFYRVVEEMPEISDSLVIHLEDPQGGNGDLILFVVLDAGQTLDDQLRRRIATDLRTALSPRHVPDRIVEVASVPRNRTGKKLEVPVKKILQGARSADVAATDALADPHSLDSFVEFAAELRAGEKIRKDS